MKETEDTDKLLDKIGKLYSDIAVVEKSFDVFLMGSEVLQHVFYACYLLAKNSEIRKSYSYVTLQKLLKIRDISPYKVKRALSIMEEAGLIKFVTKGIRGQDNLFVIINLKGYLKFMPALSEAWSNKEKEDKKGGGEPSE